MFTKLFKSTLFNHEMKRGCRETSDSFFIFKGLFPFKDIWNELNLNTFCLPYSSCIVKVNDVVTDATSEIILCLILASLDYAL